MAVSKVQIVNMGLSHLREHSIDSFTESTNEAKLASLWYDQCVKQALEFVDWPFARRRKALALHGDDPPEGVWSYRYALPDDCVSPRYFQHPVSRKSLHEPFSQELSEDGSELTLLTDVESAVLIYTRLVDNPALYPATFVSALSHLIAYRFAMSVTGKRSMASDQFQLYTREALQAAASSLNTEIADQPRDADWITARA